MMLISEKYIFFWTWTVVVLVSTNLDNDCIYKLQIRKIYSQMYQI